uniref:Uncharacterized protein n=1 Tax=Anguilla anguilla TaxID=7936 RepID=A0A0E9UV37_ANGAN
MDHLHFLRVFEDSGKNKSSKQ